MTDWWIRVLLGAGIAAVGFVVVVGSTILMIWWMNRRGTIRLKFNPHEHSVRDALQNWRDQLWK